VALKLQMVARDSSGSGLTTAGEALLESTYEDAERLSRLALRRRVKRQHDELCKAVAVRLWEESKGVAWLKNVLAQHDAGQLRDLTTDQLRAAIASA